MPLQQTSTMDALDSIATFKISPLHEMLVSLESLSMPWCPPKLAEDADESLGTEFRNELKNLYLPFNHGVILAEFAFAWEDHEDIPGFLNWVRGMNDRDFTWYVLGRLPQKDLPGPINAGSISTLIESWGKSHDAQWYIDLSWADDVDSFRVALVDIWERYWTGVFKSESQGLRETWERSVREKARLLGSRGARSFYEELCHGKNLPDPIPAGMPYEKMEFVPSCRMHYSRSVCYYGWGKLTVVYNCSASEEELEEFKHLRENLLKGFKSLADEKRLKILKLIAMNEKVVNGKWLAARLELSPSVVSRHLSQLKSSGFIDEHSSDNRNFTYSIKQDLVRKLGEDLETYILGKIAEPKD